MKHFSIEWRPRKSVNECGFWSFTRNQSGNSYSTKAKRRNAKRTKTITIKMEHHKYSDSTVLKFVTRKWFEVSALLSSQYSINNNIIWFGSDLDQICVTIVTQTLLWKGQYGPVVGCFYLEKIGIKLKFGTVTQNYVVNHKERPWCFWLWEHPKSIIVASAHSTSFGFTK